MVQHIAIPAGFLVLLFAASSLSLPSPDLSQEKKKGIVRELLDSLETKDRKPLRFIDSKKYIQHNLELEDGLDGFKKLISRLPEKYESQRRENFCRWRLRHRSF